MSYTETSSRSLNQQVSSELIHKLMDFVSPLLSHLDSRLDKRLVRTFFRLLSVIITFRHRANGLLLSELGAYLLTPDQAPAGTKRISNLLRSKKWSHHVIDDFLWQRSQNFVCQSQRQNQEVVMLWDDTNLEKPESFHLEGLCPVRSLKAKRLSRIKPGYYRPAGAPVFVPGMHWLCTMLCSGEQSMINSMRWWTTRGANASDQRSEQTQLLDQCVEKLGPDIFHVFDRGFSGSPWLSILFERRVRFIMRWPKSYKLEDGHGRKLKPGLLTRGKKSMDSRLIWDAPRQVHRPIGLYQMPVWHPDYPEQPLYLIVSRQGHGKPPWYLLTNEPIGGYEDGWRCIFNYARRWQIEKYFRVAKAEFGMQSPRQWLWENRLKLLQILTLAIAYLYECLKHPDRVKWLLRHWCHRTGKRCRELSTPLYRLRIALSRLWMSHPPPDCAMPWESSG